MKQALPSSGAKSILRKLNNLKQALPSSRAKSVLILREISLGSVNYALESIIREIRYCLRPNLYVLSPASSQMDPLEGNQGTAPQARKFCILGTTEVRLLDEKHQLRAPTVLVQRTKTPSNVFDLDGQKTTDRKAFCSGNLAPLDGSESLSPMSRTHIDFSTWLRHPPGGSSESLGK